MPAEPGGAGPPQGLSWSWQLDFGALMAALTGTPPTGIGPAGLSGASPSGTAPAGTAPAGSPGTASCGTAPAGVPADGAASPDNAADADDGGLRGPVFDDEEAVQEQILDDLERYGGLPVPVAALAGRVAERLAPGPDLAAWLAAAPVAGLGDGDLAVVAGSWRQLGSWAQANELAAVAQIVSRAAARDERIGTGADGCPVRVPASAAAEVALELTMSQYGAAGWADLAVELGWRLAATGAVLAAGLIDVPRARLIAEATGMLSQENARAVEARVLPGAGGQTTGMLRAALRRAVIAVDPAGAEDRRKEAERRARVVLYPDQDSTATLAGQRMPVIHAAAAMARIKAMARGPQAAGAAGPFDLLCAQVYISQLLGTPPVLPAADGALPDHPHDDPPGSPYDYPAGPGDPGGTDDHAGDDPGRPDDPGGTDDHAGDDPRRPDDPGGPDDDARDDPRRPDDPGGPDDDARDDPRRPDDPGGPDDDAGDGPGGPDGDSGQEPGRGPGRSPEGGRQDPDHRPAGRDHGPGRGPRPGARRDDLPREHLPRDDEPRDDLPRDDLPRDDGPADDGPPQGVPPPGDQDGPRAEDDYPCPDGGPDGCYRDDDDADSWLARMPAGDWPDLPAVIPPPFTRPRTRPPDGRPPAGLLDVSLPWETLAGTSAAPGQLGRIGPVTATQARRLAAIAAGDPGTEWRIIITTPAGHALAVTRIPRPRSPAPGAGPGQQPAAAPGPATAGPATGGPATGEPAGQEPAGQEPGARAGPGPGTGAGLVGRVTLTISQDTLTRLPPAWSGTGAGPSAPGLPGPPGAPGQILGLALRAATRATTRARATLAADTATGGCAHTTASPGYRPPPRLKEYITARDLTCRFPRCRQPAWRGDLDHTIPYDNGGLTCSCNLGGLCRCHHILKHHPDWKLVQTAPGEFTWTTPSGRTYTSTPDIHAL